MISLQEYIKNASMRHCGCNIDDFLDDNDFKRLGDYAIASLRSEGWEYDELDDIDEGFLEDLIQDTIQGIQDDLGYKYPSRRNVDSTIKKLKEYCKKNWKKNINI